MKKFLMAAVFGLVCLASVFAQSQGPSSGGIIYNDLSIGTTLWLNLTSASGSDNTYTNNSFVVIGGNTNYMSTSDFGFSIPASAVISGLEVTVERSVSGVLGAAAVDKSLKLIKGGILVGADRASGLVWQGSDGIITYGSSSDMWGTSWTPAEINASDFAVGIAVKQTGLVLGTARIDNIQVKVYFNTPLPVELVTFKALQENNDVLVSWTTASENNSDFFNVERSVDGLSFEPIFYLQAAGNSSSNIEYSVADTHPASGTSYYRLQQNDKDGKFTYSEVVVVTMAEKNMIKIFPNPASSANLNIQINGKTGQELLLQITKSGGRMCYSKKIEVQKDSYELALDVNLTPGVYFLETFDGTNKIINQQFLIE